MSSPKTSPASRTSQSFVLVPNLHISDPTAYEVDLGNQPWMVATVIEDDDLMFGGKPLSAWYEEDRRRLSSDEEDRRGRQRERVRIDHHNYQHHAHTTKKGASAKH